MVKSFKKVIACVLAVLMVVTAMPFTAFAAPGDYEPDVQLMFGIAYDSNSTISTDYIYRPTATQDSIPDFNYSGLYDAPITYKYKKNADATVSGTLVLEKDKANATADDRDHNPIDADYTLTTGDYFVVTVALTNITQFKTAKIWISYSNNIEPAGLYKYKKGTKWPTLVGSESDKNAANQGAWTKHGSAPIEAISGYQFSETINKSYNPADGTYSNEDSSTVGDGIIKVEATTWGDPEDVTDVGSPEEEDEIYFANPETGAVDEPYHYQNTAFLETYLFKVVGTGDITFGVADDNFKNCMYIASNAEIANVNYTSYHKVNIKGVEGAGSQKMTFMGMNPYTGVGMDDIGGGDEDPCDDGHDWGEWTTVTPATCTTGGQEKRTCKRDGCDEEDTRDTIALGHEFDLDKGATLVSDTYSNCTTQGKTIIKCARCSEQQITNKDLNADAHSYGNFTPNGDDTHSRVCANNELHVDTKQCSYDAGVEIKQPTYTEKGTKRYTCEVCGGYYDESIDERTCDHVGTEKTVTGAIDATCTEPGSTGTETCNECDAVTREAETINPLKHLMGEWTTTTAPTCTETGVEERTCQREGCTYKETNTLGSLGHEMSDWVVTTPATCTTDGVKTKTCQREGCDHEETETIGQLGHDFGAWVVTTPAECEKAGVETRTCQRDGCTETETRPIEALEHIAVSADNKVEATVSEDGHEADTVCQRCGKLLKAGEVIPALGVTLTINDTYSSYGSTNYAYGDNKIAYGSTVTINATEYEDCTFVGFDIDGKLVTKDKSYTYEAYKDVEITPVFEPTSAGLITVIFYDKYSNVVASYKDYTVEQFQAAMAEALPQAPIYSGYSFTGWSLSDADIKSLDHSETIWGYYKQTKEEKFVVETTDDCTLEVNRGTKVSDVKYLVTFDTYATVSNPDAKAWKVGDSIVGYGSSYSFYVGSDIKVEPVFAAVDSDATVTMIKHYQIEKGGYKIMFLASMNVPSDCKLVDHGFVYGKNLIASEMKLENVGNTGSLADAGVVKKTSAGTSPVEQFGISYGVKAMDTNACATAFLQFIKNGKLETIYSDSVIVDYSAINVDEDYD